MTCRKCSIELLQYKSATQLKLNSSNAAWYIFNFMVCVVPDPSFVGMTNRRVFVRRKVASHTNVLVPDPLYSNRNSFGVQSFFFLKMRLKFDMLLKPQR